MATGRSLPLEILFVSGPIESSKIFEVNVRYGGARHGNIVPVHEPRGLKHPLHLFARCRSAFVAAALDPDRAVIVHVRFTDSVGDRHNDHDTSGRWYILGQWIDRWAN